jgi:hypothetical protein
MMPNDLIDQVLREAGSRWRAGQPAPPDPDVARMHRATTVRPVSVGRLLFGFGTAAIVLLVLVVSLPNPREPPVSNATPSDGLPTGAAVSIEPDPSDPQSSESAPSASTGPPASPTVSPPASASPSTNGLPVHLASLRWRTITEPFSDAAGGDVRGLFRNELGNVVAWGNDQEVGQGGYAMVSFWHSTDLESWQETKIGEWGQFIRVDAVANSRNGVVAIGSLEDEAMIWWSPEGETWRQATVTPSNGWSRSSFHLGAVAANELGFLAVGNRRNSMAAWFSADGRGWHPVGEGLGAGSLHDVVVLSDGRFVVVGVDESDRDWDAASWIVSADGSQWSPAEPNEALAGPNDQLLWRVWSYRGGLLGLANHHVTEDRINCDGPCIDDDWHLYTSEDGTLWRDAAKAATAGQPSPPLEFWEYSAITAWDDGLLAVGSGTDWQVRVWYSADGLTWEPIGDPLLVNGELQPGYNRDTIHALLVDGDRLIVGGYLEVLDLDGFVMIGEP